MKQLAATPILVATLISRAALAATLMSSAALAATLISSAALAATIAPAPKAEPQAVTDTIQGATISDPYRWLENGADPKVKAWSAAENARTRAYLDGLAQRSAVRAELKRIISGSSVSYYGLSAQGGHVFCMFFDPAKQQPMLVELDASADPKSRRTVIDPNTMDAAGHTAIDWFVASPDGRHIAVSLSKNGSEDGDLHVFDATDGSESQPAIPHVQYATAGGSLAWNADGTGFWYTRYPGEEAPEADRHYNLQVYFHPFGQGAKNSDWHSDKLVLGKADGLERISEIFLDNRYRRHAVVAMVQRGDGGMFSHFVLRQDAKPVRLAGYDDRIASAIMGPDDAVYGVSHSGAPNGKIVKLAAPFSEDALANAPVIVPESDASIRVDGVEQNEPPVAFSGDRMIVRLMAGGPTELRVYELDGKASGTIPTPAVTDVGELDTMADGSLLFDVSSYLKPRYFARWTPASNVVAETALKQTSPADFSDAQVTRVFATSKDGTKIPINIVSRKGTRLDGKNPTVLYGYGGYGISMTPEFVGGAGRVWLDAGGIFSIANIRGGAEFGERWHQGGALLNKQNVFDDFAAAGQFLIDQHYTSHDKLALFGESNGGLLMGAMITQHPQLAHAVVSRVGIYDMMRVELDPNGAFNTTEFGTVKDAAQFRALYAYSPYHHVRAGEHYPAMLFTAGDTDGRVNPMHSRKFVAALQAADASGMPVLLSTSATSGHGMGDPLDAKIDRTADIQSFLMDQLGAVFEPASR